MPRIAIGAVEWRSAHRKRRASPVYNARPGFCSEGVEAVRRPARRTEAAVYRAHRIIPRLTAGRRRWLETLLLGPANRPPSVVGYHCMTLGWTDWNWVVKQTGEPISLPAAQERWPDGEHHRHITTNGEIITKDGREALRCL